MNEQARREREMHERQVYFQRINAQHGFQQVPATAVYQAFEELAQPTHLGFSTIRTGLYGRTVSDDIVHLIQLQALKGASYSVRWGVSLSYIPHESRSGLRWHRTFASSRFDLFETPYTWQRHWLEVEKDIAHTLNGPAHFLETLQTMWNRLGMQASAWFSSLQSLTDVLSRAHEQMTATGQGYEIHYPRPSMIYAFTLARLERIDEAVAALETHFRSAQAVPDAQAALRTALARISRTGAG